MSSLPFKNEYHLRHVAASASKACFICYKASDAVLVSSDGKTDYFYVCETHLKDAAFASAVIDPEVEAAKLKQQQLDAEIELLKKKWEAHQKKSKDKDAKDKKSDNDKESKESDHNKELESLESSKKSHQDIIDSPPRVYSLNTQVYNMRIRAYRNAIQVKKTQQFLSKPRAFPKVPTHIPGAIPGLHKNEKDEKDDKSAQGDDQGSV